MTATTPMKLDREFTVKVWHVVLYNLVLIVSLTAAFVRVQANVEQLIKLTDKMEGRIASVETAQHALEVKLPVMDEKLDRIRQDIAELKLELKKHP